MTEQQWLREPFVHQLIEHLRTHRRVARTKAGKRRLRLFACACLRRAWDILEPNGQRIVERLERVCDGQEPVTVLKELEDEAQTHSSWSPDLPPRTHQLRGAVVSAIGAAGYPAQHASITSSMVAAARAPELPYNHPFRRIEPEQMRAIQQAMQKETEAHVVLLHDIFGNPFRLLPSRSFPGDVRGLAQSCADGDWSVMPILIDSLSDLGEEDAANHLRQPVHVRGCHVVDWVLGRA